MEDPFNIMKFYLSLSSHMFSSTSSNFGTVISQRSFFGILLPIIENYFSQNTITSRGTAWPGTGVRDSEVRDGRAMTGAVSDSHLTLPTTDCGLDLVAADELQKKRMT